MATASRRTRGSERSDVVSFCLDHGDDENPWMCQCTREKNAKLERELAAVTAELLALRAESKALCEQVLSHNRTIAALVMQAGGEVRVDDLTIAMLPLDAEILTWSEPMERKTVVQVRTPKRQNKK